MVVFSVFFGKLAGVPSDGIPYPIFVYTGLLFWQFFSSSLGDVSNSLISNSSIVTKVYFPRLILPISTTIVKFVDFFFSALVLGGMMIFYDFIPTVQSLYVIPLLLVITFMASVGAGLILSSINVKYRDVRYALPFFIQMLLFITPVIYPASIAGKYSWILALNPMTGVINSARAVLLGSPEVNWLLLSISGMTCFVAIIIGVIVFKKTERTFADII